MKFYVSKNWAGVVFVKEAKFFKMQGGLKKDWGKHWVGPIDADSFEDARAKGKNLAVARDHDDTITVYSDGSSSGGSNACGGWGWVIVRGQEILLAGFGGDSSSTNNLMEIHGATEGLETVKRKKLRKDNEQVVLVSDSMYVLNFVKGVTKAKRNVEQVDRLKRIALELDVTGRWVAGHGLKYRNNWEEYSLDVLMNHRADALADHGRRKILEALAKGKEQGPI